MSTKSDPMDTAASAVGHLYEAKERLKDAAVATGGAIKQAAVAAKDNLRDSGDMIGKPLSDARSAASTAASEVGEAASAELDVLVDKGRDLWASAEELIRKHPVGAFGAAFATGWLIAKLMRRS
jgi:ElaB/YqjD/DUF883 family membrane-anchored ribosome-binding protein